jgi:hypothetical protein
MMEKSRMPNTMIKTVGAIVFAAGLSSFASVAQAAPVSGAFAIKNAVPATIETVQWRRRGIGWGGVGAGFVAGAIIGGALASPYYGYGPYYYPAPYPYYAPPPGPVYYGAPGPAYGAPPTDDAVAYCSQRFRSYDPASGTYLGYDGQRHPCP